MAKDLSAANGELTDDIPPEERIQQSLGASFAIQHLSAGPCHRKNGP